MSSTLYDVLDGLPAERRLPTGSRVRLIDCMPRVCPIGRTLESAIVESARVSYGRGLKTPMEDFLLLDNLIRNQHTSPLESVSFVFELKVPIFVARQIMRHRTAKVNEFSQRYSKVEEGHAQIELRKQGSSHNKQSSEEGLVDDEALESQFHAAQRMAFNTYAEALDRGVAREVARTVLPVSTFTVIHFQMDLNNLFKFFSLRLEAGAQKEIQEVAGAMKDLITPLIPDAMAIFDDRSEGIFLSRRDLEVLCISLDADAEYRGPKGAYRELVEKLRRISKPNLFPANSTP